MKKKNVHNLSTQSFAGIFGIKEENMPHLAREAINKANFNYKIVEGKAYEDAILKIIKMLDSGTLKVAGPHRRSDWEKGWKENLLEFKQSRYRLDQLIPKFVKKGDYIRFQGNFINPKSNSFETDFVTVLRCYLFEKYFKNVDTLYEFGAGTGLNLVATSEIFPSMKLIGLDWADSSVAIITALKQKLGINISAGKFDLFRPDRTYRLKKSAAVLTIGTLEQLGKKFRPFIYYLLKNNPTVCIHMETLYEMYNRNDLLDYLAIKYLEKRNYLQGFLPFLRSLELKKRVKIIAVKRTFGSFYHEGYTYIVWKPL